MAMAVSKRAWRVLTELDFQPSCELDDDGEDCPNYAVWAMFRIPCDCEDFQPVWLMCNRHKKWVIGLEPAQCTDCDVMFEPTGAAAFKAIQRLSPKG